METAHHADRRTVEAVEGVHLSQLAVGERTSVQHFHFEPGASVPEHSHEHEQVGYLAGGRRTFLVDGEEHAVRPGDAYLLPGGEPHAVENRTDEPAQDIDVFAPPRPDPDWLE